MVYVRQLFVIQFPRATLVTTLEHFDLLVSDLGSPNDRLPTCREGERQGVGEGEREREREM